MGKPDGNLRQAAERYAIAQQVPQLLAEEADYARQRLVENEKVDMPLRVRRDVTACGKSHGVYLEQLKEHIARGEIGGAVLAAYELGRVSQMMVRRGTTHLAVAGSHVRNASRTARAVKNEKAASRRKEITVAVKARMAANKKDSLHFARHHVASALGVSFDAVKRATAKMKPRKKIKK